jgi:hypothetical protein
MTASPQVIRWADPLAVAKAKVNATTQRLTAMNLAIYRFPIFGPASTWVGLKMVDLIKFFAAPTVADLHAKQQLPWVQKLEANAPLVGGLSLLGLCFAFFMTKSRDSNRPHLSLFKKYHIPVQIQGIVNYVTNNDIRIFPYHYSPAPDVDITQIPANELGQMTGMIQGTTKAEENQLKKQGILKYDHWKNHPLQIKLNRITDPVLLLTFKTLMQEYHQLLQRNIRDHKNDQMKIEFIAKIENYNVVDYGIKEDSIEQLSWEIA